MFEISCAGTLSVSLGGPLGSSAKIIPKPNLAGANKDTWLSLLESSFWRCGTHVHACSECVHQVGGFYHIHFLYALLNLKLLYCSNTVYPVSLQVKKTTSQVEMIVLLFLCLVWMQTVSVVGGRVMAVR
jgi:hypothetical protein